MALVEARAEVGGSPADVRRGEDGHYEIIVKRLEKENDLVLRMYFDKNVYTSITYENERIDLVGREIVFSGFHNKMKR